MMVRMYSSLVLVLTWSGMSGMEVGVVGPHLDVAALESNQQPVVVAIPADAKHIGIELYWSHFHPFVVEHTHRLLLGGSRLIDVDVAVNCDCNLIILMRPTD
jgi:hypothetical protein